MNADTPPHGLRRLWHGHHQPIEAQALQALYAQPEPTQENHMNLIDTIQAEALHVGGNIGGDIHAAYQHALEKHLTTANMAAHVAARVAELDANPLVSAVVESGLGPQGSAALAEIIHAASAGLARLDQAAQAIPLPEPPLEPLPAPAADPESAPGDAA